MITDCSTLISIVRRLFIITMMVVSSMKDCLYKISARIRDILDVVDSYYRPSDIPCGQTRVINDNSPKPNFLEQMAREALANPCSPELHNNIMSAYSSHRNKPHGSHSKSHRQQQHQDFEEPPPVHHQLLTTTQQSRGFTKRKTPQGQVYFLDFKGRKYWYDPSVPRDLLCASLSSPQNLDFLVGRLSQIWEIRQTPNGRTYYVNHIKKTTQFTDPRLIAYKDYLMSILNGQNANTAITNNQRHRVSNTGSSRTTNSSQSTLSPNNRNCQPKNTYSSKHNQPSLSSHPKRSPVIAPIRPPTNHTPSPDTNTNSNSRIFQSCVTPTPLNSSDYRQQSFPTTQKINANSGRPKSSKELFDKISILRQELLKQQVIAHPCKIDINRKRIFEESFRIVSQMQPRDLKKRLLIKFKGEEGLDYGGVAREWFYLLSREILNPIHGLFQYTSDDIYNLQINPDSGIVYREHLSYMNFCGRVIGMAVFHGHFIEGHFTMPFYKMLLRKSITLSDIELVDPELYRSLCWILENDITNVIDTTFSVQHNAFGELKEHELKENGKNIAVTEANKHEYVCRYVNYRCRRGIEHQFEALQRGFYELISPMLVGNFDEYELELLIGGLSKINLEDWKTNTKLKNCTIDTPLVRWFWDIVESYNEDKRARLLQFVTGSPRVPIQGFKALQGVNSELRLFTIHLIKNACTDDLPKSHTCFNRIDLPPYESFEKLRDKLTQAIEETMGFAIQ